MRFILLATFSGLLYLQKLLCIFNELLHVTPRVIYASTIRRLFYRYWECVCEHSRRLCRARGARAPRFLDNLEPIVKFLSYTSMWYLLSCIATNTTFYLLSFWGERLRNFRGVLLENFIEGQSHKAMSRLILRIF